MTILHVTAPAAFGGLESVVQSLATGQREQGHDVHVAAVVERPDQGQVFLESLRHGDVGVHVLAVSGRAYLTERARIGALCRSLRPHVVHTHGYRPDVVDAGVARGLGVPTVTTVHGFTGHNLRNRTYEWLQRIAFRRFQAVVAVSRPLAEHLGRSGVPGPRLHVVRNAWRPRVQPLSRAAARAELRVPDGRFVVGWVGRLSREKGLDVLIDAMAWLKDVPISVLVLGDGRERSALQERAASAGVAGAITWHPAVPEAARLFGAFDVFALSSHVEGTPMVIMEAMAAGVPIVAAAVGGVPDMVTADEALLVPPGEPRALAAALRQVATDTGAAMARARAASARLASEFAVGPWLAAYEAIYRGIRAQAPRGA